MSPNTLRRIEAGIKKFWGAWAEPFLIVLRGTKDGTPERTCIELDHPLPTLAARVGHIGLVEPFLANISHGNPDGNFARRTHSIDRPYYTLTGLNEQALVSPFLVSFYGNGEALSIDEPFATVTCKDRFGVVQQYGLDILAGAVRSGAVGMRRVTHESHRLHAARLLQVQTGNRQAGGRGSRSHGKEHA